MSSRCNVALYRGQDGEGLLNSRCCRSTRSDSKLIVLSQYFQQPPLWRKAVEQYHLISLRGWVQQKQHLCWWEVFSSPGDIMKYSVQRSAVRICVWRAMVSRNHIEIMISPNRHKYWRAAPDVHDYTSNGIPIQRYDNLWWPEAARQKSEMISTLMMRIRSHSMVPQG